MARAKRALVVDDSLSTRMIVAAMLAELCPGWSIIKASNADDALAKAIDGPIDCMLIDFNMPGIDGLELAARLRERYPAAHIALLTASIQDGVRRRADARGYQFLAKPVSEEKLRAFVEDGKG